jgi:hypothetical protein
MKGIAVIIIIIIETSAMRIAYLAARCGFSSGSVQV